MTADERLTAGVKGVSGTSANESKAEAERGVWFMGSETELTGIVGELERIESVGAWGRERVELEGLTCVDPPPPDPAPPEIPEKRPVRAPPPSVMEAVGGSRC